MSGVGSSLSDEIQLARQPIFAASGTVEAYQLLTRTETLLDVFSSLNESAAAAKLLSDTFLQMDVWSLTGGLPAYLRLPAELLLDGVASALPADLTIVQFTDDAEPTTELFAACEELRSSGYRLALGGVSEGRPRRELRAVADIVKVDVGRTSTAFQWSVITEAHRAGRRVIAENVDTRQQEATARLLDFDGYQGLFFQQPSTVRQRRVSGSRIAYLQLLNAVNGADIDYDEVADIIRRDVSLAWKFLNYINAAYFGWQRRIESISQGLVLLGQNGVRRWVSLMVVTDMANTMPQPLVVDAICRARLCERVAERLKNGPSPLSGFLVGMFSLLDAMVDEPLEEVFDHVSLPDDVVDAIVSGAGELGLILGLVAAYERGAWGDVEDRAAALGLRTAELTSMYLDALSWAHTSLEARKAEARPVDEDRSAG